MTTSREIQPGIDKTHRLKIGTASTAMLSQIGRLQKMFRLIMLYLLAGLIALICLLPILWMAKTSFETPQFIRNAQVQFWPLQFTLENYKNVLTNPHAMIWRAMLNSLTVASIATVLNLMITTSAGYAMSRFEFKGKLVFGMYLLMIYMIPRTLILIGLFDDRWLQSSKCAAAHHPAAIYARGSRGRSVPVCGLLERIHDRPDHHPIAPIADAARADRLLYGHPARRMGASDGFQHDRRCTRHYPLLICSTQHGQRPDGGV